MIYEIDDGDFIKVEIKGDKIKVKAAGGYSSGVEDLLTLENNENGYYVKRKSYVSTQADKVYNLDYDEIEYIYYAYKAILEGKESKNA